MTALQEPPRCTRAHVSTSETIHSSERLWKDTPMHEVFSNPRLTTHIMLLSGFLGVGLNPLALSARADMLDFEDLPSLLEANPRGAVAPLEPNFTYHGFTFAANHKPGSSSQVDNTWYYSNVPESEQDPPYTVDAPGMLWSVQSGEAALMSGPNYVNGQSRFIVTRVDGGLWRMDGAWFTRAFASAPGDLVNRLKLAGTLAGQQVYMSWQSIHHGSRKFVAPPLGLTIDRLELSMHWLPGGADRTFFMDDFRYTLVPGPSALCVLGLATLVRGRRR